MFPKVTGYKNKMRAVFNRELFDSFMIGNDLNYHQYYDYLHEQYRVGFTYQNFMNIINKKTGFTLDKAMLICYDLNVDIHDMFTLEYVDAVRKETRVEYNLDIYEDENLLDENDGYDYVLEVGYSNDKSMLNLLDEIREDEPFNYIYFENENIYNTFKNFNKIE